MLLEYFAASVVCSVFFCGMIAMKKYLALARVSSREQEREGFSLAVQEDALKRYAEQHGGVITRMFSVAETASKNAERKTFQELLTVAKAQAGQLDGLLFYKIDRAARNLFDYVELERLESDYGVPFISVSQHTENNPAGKMMRRTLASMAAFYTDQLSVDVREGHARRVQEGWFLGKAPYGYRNIRKDGRGLIEIDPEPAENVRRIFNLFAYEPLTIDGLVDRLHEAGRRFRQTMAKFPRSSVHNILLDRAYIGELEYKGEWYPGKHEPLVERGTWNRVQALLGGKTYKAHQLTYAGGLVKCAHCGNLVTGEQVIKKSTGKQYVYYRCTMYNVGDHPRIRLTEADLDKQVLAVFRAVRQSDEIRDWFSEALREWSKQERGESRAQTSQYQRELTQLQQQEDKLLNLRLLEEINSDTFGRKSTELRDRIADVTLKIEATNRDRSEQAELAIRTFELSQALEEKWLTADYSAKRQILETVFLNLKLDGVSLCYEMTKPFAALAKGLLVPSNRGDKIRTCDL
jgi:site-specific DNA recombinase